MNDEDLKRRFRELRARDTRNAPAFEVVTAKRPRRVSPLVVAMPLLAAAAGLMLWCGVAKSPSAPRGPHAAVAYDAPPPPETTARITAPAALPLDFLLESTPIHVHLDSDPTEGLVP